MPPARQAGKRKDRAIPVRKQVKAQRQAVYRRAISDAAERVFAEKGTDKSPMRAIAAEAGISLGTLYGVIDGKRELFIEIHETRMIAFLECIRSARDGYDTTLARQVAGLQVGAR